VTESQVRTSAVARVTVRETMAESIAPAAMMSTSGGLHLRDVAAAATHSTPAALAPVITNAQEA